MSETENIAWPVKMVGPSIDEGLIVAANLADIAMGLEFYDDFSPERVQLTAADGTPLRLIVHKVEVLLCRKMRSTPHRPTLTLNRCRNSFGLGHAEFCGDVLHRVLWDDGNYTPTVPIGEPDEVSVTGAPKLTLRDFNSAWIEAHYEKWPRRSIVDRLKRSVSRG